MKRATLVGAALLAACSLGAARAAAEPLVRTTDLSSPAGAAVLGEIARARRLHPARFDQVRAVRASAPARDRQRHGRVAQLAPALRALGKDALLPMLSALLDDAPDEPARVTLAVHLGLLQAIGELRDARAHSVLVAALDRATDPRLARTAAAALGALGTDEAIDALLARTSSPAAIAGLGAARRARATGALAAMLDGADDITAVHIMDALGDAANEWAWQTSKVAASGERDAVVGVAAAALARSFVLRRGDARARAAKALRLAGAGEAVPALRVARDGAAGEARDAAGRLLAELTRQAR
ncbi:MAG: hypothetical protein IT374_18535 [Polyangiaceae bacterium]|nr:hypothetical protein [Polyangiaceae bacterium]